MVVDGVVLLPLGPSHTHTKPATASPLSNNDNDNDKDNRDHHHHHHHHHNRDHDKTYSFGGWFDIRRWSLFCCYRLRPMITNSLSSARATLSTRRATIIIIAIMLLVCIGRLTMQSPRV
jgi:ABC-type Zn2+ transport system substrate-binding protein/surface adhesin